MWVWFVSITIVVFFTVIIFIPKHMSWLEIYTTTWFALSFEFILNILLSLKFDLYGYFSKGVDLEGFIVILGLYPTYNVIFLNFFPKSNRWKQTLYILGHSLFVTCYEYAILHTEAFYYNGWKLWYSALCYPVIFLVLYWNLLITRWLFARAQH